MQQPNPNTNPPANAKCSYGAGSILANNQLGTELGALVKLLPDNKVLLFKIQDKTYPVFSKLVVNPLVSKVGHINDVDEDGRFKHADLREQLLKYYNTRNISKNERGVLEDFLNETFPLGVPAYHPERTIEEANIH